MIRKALLFLKDFAARRQELLVKTAAYGGAAGCAALVLFFGPPKLIERTETPKFCGLCHSMGPQYSAWERSAHRSARCIDCHLPNDNAANHYFWKAIDGNKDVFYEFSGLREHDEIRLSGHGRRVLQANCVRCHETLVTHVDRKRACFDCHRTMGHKMLGSLSTRED